MQGLHALAMLGDLEGVEVLLTADEEIGSPTSRELIEDAARDAQVALVLEPSADAGERSRAGRKLYRIEIKGRAAHAGLEPEKGVNALTEMARQVVRRLGAQPTDLGRRSPRGGDVGNVDEHGPRGVRVQPRRECRLVAEQERVDALTEAFGRSRRARR